MWPAPEDTAGSLLRRGRHPECRPAVVRHHVPMTALRSRRLESVLGAPLDALTSDHIRGLVTATVQEAFDLDFKRTLYGRGDSDKRSLAGDVAALANTAGGIIVLGVEEDEHARATATPGVEMSEGEVTRIRRIVASLVAPIPDFDVLTVSEAVAAAEEPVVASADTPTRGFVVIAVPRSPSTPHAVLVDEKLRYPKRNGSTIRYLSEPEVATAYRDRFAGAQRQAVRVEEIERDALDRLDTADQPWAVVTLVPDLAGDLTLSRDVYLTFQQQIKDTPATVVDTGTNFYRARVGRRRLLADGTMDNSPLAKRVSLELHTDGSGFYGVTVATQQGLQPNWTEPRPQIVSDESIAIGVMSGLVHLARHARDRAAAGGTALVRAQIFPVSSDGPIEIGHSRRFGSVQSLSSHPLTVAPTPAEAAAPLDELAEPGPTLVEAAALLIDELGQAFGIPEMGQLTHDGRLRRKYWDDAWQQEIVTWASEQGIVVTDETLP